MSGTREQPREGMAEIGREMADAIATEARHRVANPEPSPLAGITYDPLRPRPDLLRFEPSPTDDVIERFVSQNATSNPREVAEVRRRLTMDDFYTLIDFARRAALRTLRTLNPLVAETGIRGLALIDGERIDRRDAAAAADMLSYALLRADADASAPPSTAVLMAEATVGAVLRHIADRPTPSLAHQGYREISTPDGAALIRDDARAFNPTVDLLAIALRAVDLIEADEWVASEITIGSDMPDVWLRLGDRHAMEAAKATVRACVHVDASPRAKSEKAWTQAFTVHLAEATSPETAETIASSVTPSHSDTLATLGTHFGRLCCILVARSFVVGTPSFERGTSLDRFRAGLETILAERST